MIDYPWEDHHSPALNVLRFLFVLRSLRYYKGRNQLLRMATLFARKRRLLAFLGPIHSLLRESLQRLVSSKRITPYLEVMNGNDFSMIYKWGLYHCQKTYRPRPHSFRLMNKGQQSSQLIQTRGTTVYDALHRPHLSKTWALGKQFLDSHFPDARRRC